MIAVLGIYGSPRKGGNSDVLLDTALKGAKENGADVVKVYARDLEISGCRGCDGCAKTGSCVIHDDMELVYGLIDKADAIILSSPIYFYGLTSQMKALIDRGQALWWRKRLGKVSKGENKKGRGHLIAVGATKGENLFKGAQLTVMYFFDALDMSYEGGLFFPGIEPLGAVKEHSGILEQAYGLGKKAVQDSV